MNNEHLKWGSRIADCGIKTRNSKGLTLIEVILVMVIIAILSAVVIPKIGFDLPSRTSLEGAAHMVASDIRYAQECAMATRTSKTITFLGGNSYSFTPPNNLDPSGQLPSGVTITKDLTVKFNSLGEPIFEVGDGSVIISESGISKTITIINYTGKVNMS